MAPGRRTAHCCYTFNGIAPYRATLDEHDMGDLWNTALWALAAAGLLATFGVH